MNIEEKLKRSRSKEKIDFRKIPSLNQKDPLVKVESSATIIVEPNWTLDEDFEGKIYADHITQHPEYDGIYVRPELLKRLIKAADSLNDMHGKYKLVLRAGHRPLEVQKRLLKECAEDYQKSNPGTSDEDALKHARTFVSDPTLELPPHCCGAAVDVDVLDTTTKKFVDFGSFLNEDNEKSYIYSDQITQKQRENRLILLRAMLDAGFASCYFEWWHFSYGDQVWAWFYGKDKCLYSLMEPDLAPNSIH